MGSWYGVYARYDFDHANSRLGPWLYIGEIFPSRIREIGIAMGAASQVSRYRNNTPTITYHFHPTAGSHPCIQLTFEFYSGSSIMLCRPSPHTQWPTLVGEPS